MAELDVDVAQIITDDIEALWTSLMRPGKKHSLLRLPMPFTEWLCPLSGQRLIYRDVYVVDHHGWESGIARGKDVRGSLRKVRSPLSIHEGLGQRLSRVLRPYTDDPPTILHRSGGHGKKSVSA